MKKVNFKGCVNGKEFSNLQDILAYLEKTDCIENIFLNYSEVYNNDNCCSEKCNHNCEECTCSSEHSKICNNVTVDDLIQEFKLSKLKDDIVNNKNVLNNLEDDLLKKMKLFTTANLNKEESKKLISRINDELTNLKSLKKAVEFTKNELTNLVDDLIFTYSRCVCEEDIDKYKTKLRIKNDEKTAIELTINYYECILSQI